MEFEKIKKQYQNDIDYIINELKIRYKRPQIKLVQKAYEYAIKAHINQKRESGEPYIVHPIYVAKIIADMKLDDETVIAGLLHDTIEDTDVTYDDIKREFSESIANMVQGVSKLKGLKYETKEEKDAENYKKMFLAMGKDIRVIIIKLADRLHNMRTLNYKTREAQKRKAKETLDIYAPIANRLRNV